jgi:serine/threonine protein kinase
MIGKTLTHYEVTSELGKGGMGEVYQTTDTKLGRQVAIRTLPQGFARGEDRLARFDVKSSCWSHSATGISPSSTALEEHEGLLGFVAGVCPFVCSRPPIV